MSFKPDENSFARRSAMLEQNSTKEKSKKPSVQKITSTKKETVQPKTNEDLQTTKISEKDLPKKETKTKYVSFLFTDSLNEKIENECKRLEKQFGRKFSKNAVVTLVLDKYFEQQF